MRENSKDKPFKWWKFRHRCDVCGVKDYSENLICRVNWELDYDYFHESCVIDVISNPDEWRTNPWVLEICMNIVERWKRRGKYVNELVKKANSLCKGG